MEETTSSSPTEISPIPSSPTEDSDHVTFISSSSLTNNQRSTSCPSDTIAIHNENHTTTETSEECLSNTEPYNTTMVIITSPSFTADLSSEQNDSIDQLNSSSFSFLQTKQCRTDHRRIKSEPFKSASIEDLPSATVLELSSTSTTSSDLPLNDNSTNEVRRQSSTKVPSPSMPIKHLTQDKGSLSSSSTTSRKKKAWYNPFQTTYRQRNEEFRKIFKELPNEERLIVDYSCAWQKDILIQGRMYLSQNYLCFHANILNWKTSLCLKFQDIVGITREKTAKVISNAIEIKSNKAEKYFFASFVTRDKTYTVMFRLWQATLVELPIPSQQVWAMIHESYGDDLDMTTDEEDTCHKSPLNSPKQQIQSSDKYDLSNIVLRITPKSVHSKSLQQDDDCSSVSSRGDHQTDDEGIILTAEETTTNIILPQFKEDMNTTSEIVQMRYLTQCPCQSHLATEIINRTYSMPVEQLFECIFGDNDFLLAYRASRRIKEFHASEWQLNNETGKRERLCTYKVTVAAVFGSTTICSNERQIIDNEQSKSYYIIDTEVRNEGIKYADSFYVATRYCLIQLGPNKSHFKLTCEVRYVKSLMAIIKSFIEKNAMAALQDSFTDLMKRMDQESSKRSRTFHTSNNNEKDKGAQSQSMSNTRSSSREQEQIDDLTYSMNDLSINSQEDEEDSTHDQINPNIVRPDPLVSSKNIFITSFCLITILLLLIVNIFLYIKLNRIDQMTDRLVQSYPTWLNRYSSQQEDNEWSLLLKRQEEYYQTQITSLRTVLTTTHNALRNVTDALHQLSKLSGGSS